MPKAAAIKPYYFLVGLDQATVDEYLNSILRVLFNGSADSSSVVSFDCSEKGEAKPHVNSIIEEAGTVSMFNPVKAVIVRNVTLLKDEELRPLVDFLKVIPDGSHVIMTAKEKPKADKRKKVQSPVFEIPNKEIVLLDLSEEEKALWACDYLKSQGKKLDAELAAYIVDQCNGDMHAVKNELEKLLLVSSGREQVSADDYAEVAGFSKENNMWDLTGAVSDNNPKKAYKVLENIFDNSSSEQIVGAIAGEIRRIYLAKLYVRNKVPESQIYSLIGPSYSFIKPKLKLFDKIPFEKVLEILRQADIKGKFANKEMKKSVITVMFEGLFDLMDGNR